MLRRFYLVSRLRCAGLLLVPLRGLLIHSHIVCTLCSRTAVSSACNIVCEKNDDDDKHPSYDGGLKDKNCSILFRV